MSSKGLRQLLVAVLFSLGSIASGASAQAHQTSNQNADACVVTYHYDSSGQLIEVCYGPGCPNPGCYP